jgi:hypothetical protein
MKGMFRGMLRSILSGQEGVRRCTFSKCWCTLTLLKICCFTTFPVKSSWLMGKCLGTILPDSMSNQMVMAWKRTIIL